MYIRHLDHIHPLYLTTQGLGIICFLQLHVLFFFYNALSVFVFYSLSPVGAVHPDVAIHQSMGINQWTQSKSLFPCSHQHQQLISYESDLRDPFVHSRIHKYLTRLDLLSTAHYCCEFVHARAMPWKGDSVFNSLAHPPDLLCFQAPLLWCFLSTGIGVDVGDRVGLRPPSYLLSAI